MKIIGTVGREGLIVEASRDEIARCLGYPYESSMPNNSKLELGIEVPVCEAYSLATEIIGSSRELADAKSKLANVIKAIEALQKVSASKAEIIKSKMPQR